MNDIIPTIEDHTNARQSVSSLRQAARLGTSNGIYDLETSIHQLILNNVPARSIENDREHRDRCTTLSQSVMTAVEEHFRSRIYDHIDGLACQIDSNDTVAPDEAGYWTIALTLADAQVTGPNITFEARLESQDHPRFSDMIGISATVTVNPEFGTISVEPSVRSHIEMSDMNQLVSYSGPQRPGLRDDREGSSATVLVEDLDRRYEECTKTMLREIRSLVQHAEGDLREAFEYDHEEIADKLSGLGVALQKEIKSDPDLGSLLTADLSRWALSLDTVPIEDADYELEDQEMSATGSPPSAFDLIGDMATRRRRFVLKSSGIPLLDGLFPRKIDCIPTEKLISQWESSRRSQALSHWSQQVDPVGGSPIPWDEPMDIFEEANAQ
jgi:hypothetical protein